MATARCPCALETGQRDGGKVTPCFAPGALQAAASRLPEVAGELSLVAGSRDVRRLRRAIYAESRADPAGCCGDVSSRARWSTLTSPSRQKTSGPQS